MFINNQKILIKKLISDIGKENFFYLIALFFLFFSINSGYYHLTTVGIYHLTDSNIAHYGFEDLLNYTRIDSLLISIVLYINKIRFLSCIVIFPIALYLLYKKKYKNDLLLNIFTPFILIQLITFFYYYRDPAVALNNSPLFFDSVYLLMNVLTTLIIINLIKNKTKILQFFIIFLIIFFVAYSGIVIIKLIPEYFAYAKKYYLYASYLLAPDTYLLGQVAPRVTGVARVSLIIYFFCICYIYFKKDINFITFFLVALFASIYLFFIYGMQSRGALLGLFFFSILFLFLFKLNIKKKLLYLVLLILPILTYEIPFKNYIDSLPKNFIEVDNYDKPVLKGESNDLVLKGESNDLVLKDKKLGKISKIPSDQRRDLLLPDDTSFLNYSSGRIALWKRSIDLVISKKLYLGFGPQADRYLLSERAIEDGMNPAWGNNSSNAIIYCMLSAGLVGLIFILIVYMNVTILLFRTLFRKRLKPMSFFMAFNISVLTFLVLRSLFENGFTIFGIDFILFVISYYYLKEDLVKLKKIVY